MNMIKLAVVDDHEVFRKGIRTIAGEMGGCEILFEASNGMEFLDLLQKSPLPDIVLLDLQMPVMDGLETLEILFARFPKIKTLILTMSEDYATKRRLLDMDINGFVNKFSSVQILIEAINAISQEKLYFDPVLTREMKEWLGTRGGDEHLLTNREQDVLQLICKQYTTPEIAETLNMAVDTVKGHRKRLFEKTGCKNLVGLAFFAIKNNLVFSDEATLKGSIKY